MPPTPRTKYGSVGLTPSQVASEEAAQNIRFGRNTPAPTPAPNTSGFDSLKDMSIANSPAPTPAPRNNRGGQDKNNNPSTGIQRPIRESSSVTPDFFKTALADETRNAQTEINALNQYASEQLAALQPRQDERLRETASVNSLTGLGGSTEANVTTEKTSKVNQKEDDLVRAESAARVANILGNVSAKALNRATFDRKAFTEDADTRMAQERADLEETVSNIATLSATGVDADAYKAQDPEGYAYLAEKVGGEALLKAQFTLNRPKETILDKRIENGKYVIAWQNPIDNKIRIETVDLGIPTGYTKTIDAGNRILAIPDDWDGDVSKLITINKGLTPSQAASGSGGSGGGGGTVSKPAQDWADLITAGKAKISNVPNNMRNEVATAMANADPTVTGANTQAVNSSNTAIDTIDDIFGKIAGIGSGADSVRRWLMQNVPGTEARDIQTKIDTLDALVGFDALAQMRAASPTGGALGQITERELKLLAATQGSFDASQSTAQLNTTLEKIKKSFARIRAINSVNTTPAQYKAEFPDATPEELQALTSRVEVSRSITNPEVGGGGGEVNVISPDGQVGTIPASQLQEALAQGFRQQ